MSTARIADEEYTLSEVETPPARELPANVATEKPVCATVEDFVGHVIYDGRFLATFTMEPKRVAEQLEIAITPEVVSALLGRDRGMVLAEVTAKMTREYGEKNSTKGIPEVTAFFVAVVIVGIVGVVLFSIPGCETPIVVEDNSPDADKKL